MSGQPKTENRELRLCQLTAQARALLSSIGTVLPYAPEAKPPSWMSDIAVRILREVKDLLSDPEYFRHMSMAEVLDGRPVEEKTVFELHAILSCAYAAAEQSAEQSVPAMGFKP